MLPEHAPYLPDQRRALDIILSTMDVSQRAWLAGFLSTPAQSPMMSPSSSQPLSQTPLTVLYGTESGNAEDLADRTVKAAKKRGFQAVMRNMADWVPADLAKLTDLLVIVSTWGEGEPPESATSFHAAFMQEKHDLSKVRFSVCSLGDTSYEKFCQIGKDFDARLEALGGNRVAPRQDCDVDFEDDFNAWMKAALRALTPAVETNTATLPPELLASPVAVVKPTIEYGKKHPFPSVLREKVLLNDVRSSKETLHLELSLEGSGLEYLPGDSLAVLAVNADDTVAEILKAAQASGDEIVEVKGEGEKPFAEALRQNFDITALSRSILTKLAAAAEGTPELAEILADDAKERLKAYVSTRQIVDAIEDFYPQGISAKALAGVFRKLPPRLYSIASSPVAHPGEVHLTVAAVRYETHGRKRKGVCSTYLADIAEVNTSVPVFVTPNKNFRLPDDPSVPMIMVGPGTGIAPFRAFIEHRAATGATGKNWLFFGDQHFLHDYLYQLELMDHLKEGSLHRLDLAFSRDQPEKIYVQHRMRENAEQLYAWLEEGAHFYVCGDASRMAHDVHEELLFTLESVGGKSREEAEAYIEDLRKTKRYQRDVY